MPKRHINIRVDEKVMSKVDDLLKRYPRISMASAIEACIASFFSLPKSDQESALGQYLLEGFKDSSEKLPKKKT